MINTNSEEKSCHSKDKTRTGHRKVIEELIFHTAKGFFDIYHSKSIECDLKNPYNPKYYSMDSINQDEENETNEWKPKHILSIEKRDRIASSITLLLMPSLLMCVYLPESGANYDLVFHFVEGCG